MKVIKLLAPNIDTLGHTVGQGVDSCVSNVRSWGRNTESCNFSALVMAQRAISTTMATIIEGPGWYPLAERKMNFVLTVILLRGVFGVLHRTSCGSYASQLHRQSFLVNKECLPTCVPKFEEEQVISLQFICSQQDVSKRRRKKRKQVDDGTAMV